MSVRLKARNMMMTSLLFNFSKRNEGTYFPWHDMDTVLVLLWHGREAMLRFRDRVINHRKNRQSSQT